MKTHWMAVLLLATWVCLICWLITGAQLWVCDRVLPSALHARRLHLSVYSALAQIHLRSMSSCWKLITLFRSCVIYKTIRRKRSLSLLSARFLPFSQFINSAGQNTAAVSRSSRMVRSLWVRSTSRARLAFTFVTKYNGKTRTQRFLTRIGGTDDCGQAKNISLFT